MAYFLIVYDQRAGQILHREEFPGHVRDKALAERFRLEKEHLHDSNIEVVLLGAPSEEALLRTHGRYFKSLTELVK
jgi:hypothetical protein